MTRKDRDIISTMWGNRGMKGYTTNGGGGYCNLLRGNFEDLTVRRSSVTAHKAKKPKVGVLRCF